MKIGKHLGKVGQLIINKLAVGKFRGFLDFSTASLRENMNHREIELNLRKLGSAFILGRGASLEKIRETEAKLGINFPIEIIHFYETLNGLSVTSPKFELLPVEELQQKK